MQNNHHSTNEYRHQDIEPNTGKNKRDDSEGRECGEEEAVVDGEPEEDNGTITEEEEKEPRGEDGEVDDEGERVPEKTEEEDEEDYCSVVNAEMVEVAFHSVSRFVEGVRGSEGLEREEAFPWAARGVVGGCGGAWGKWGR
ncbi:unnamed protein product [Lathyrus oleraceus]|uniref:Uncharacterized protein n=1 Tax=Pisum sativum TaxID=3888 RepID=A0A9D5A4E7_PEA|nr:hypothetical protein KIW84_061588 [Pisum sativum]